MKERTNERKQPSQLDQILAVLESGGTLTALDALEDFGCSRLASRITDLKRLGVPVASRMVQRRNRYGRLCRVAEYMVNDGEKAAYVGTNSEYGVYVECGTGIYYPGGRQTPWVYKDEKGDWHLTHGQRAKPFSKTAVAEHGEQYKKIIEAELKGK